jgi:hypothetical protein
VIKASEKPPSKLIEAPGLRLTIPVLVLEAEELEDVGVLDILFRRLISDCRRD